MTNDKTQETDDPIEFLENHLAFLRFTILPGMVNIKGLCQKSGRDTDKIQAVVYDTIAEIERLTKSIQELKAKRRAGDA